MDQESNLHELAHILNFEYIKSKNVLSNKRELVISVKFAVLFGYLVPDFQSMKKLNLWKSKIFLLRGIYKTGFEGVRSLIKPPSGFLIKPPPVSL